MENAPPRRWPPGFRFSPTDEELVLYFLKRRIASGRPTPYIADVEVYKSHPSHLPERSALQTGDRQWFFFSRLDRKYPNGSRASRTTGDGYWKATGKDRFVCSGGSGGRPVGNKKTLVYHHGRAPRGERTDWVMYEYTILADALPQAAEAREAYALYKLFQKSGVGPKNGEQYGAPFREEDWLDDDDEEQVQGLPPVAAAHPVATTTNCAVAVEEQADRDLSTAELEELLSEFGNDQEEAETPLNFSTFASSRSKIQNSDDQGCLRDGADKAQVVDASIGNDDVPACTDLPLGDIEELLMRVSDDQQNAELFRDLSTSVPELQLQHDNYQAWLSDSCGEQIGHTDPTVRRVALVAAECTSTEVPVEDLEGLLLQIANDQEMVEPASELSTSFPHYNFNQVGVGDAPHGDPAGTLSCIVQDSTDLGPRTGLSCQTQSHLTNVPFSGETNSGAETSASRSVSSLMNYSRQDADESEFLEINDFFDLEDVEQIMNCIETEGLISPTDGNLEYTDAPLFLPGPFNAAGAVAENQFVDLVNSGIQDQGYQYTTEVMTHNQVTHNVQSHTKRDLVILSSHTSATQNIRMESEPPNQGSNVPRSWFSAAFSSLLDSVPSSPALAAEIENTVINRTLQRISSFRSQQAANGENTVIYRTIQRISSFKSPQAPTEEPSIPVIKATRGGRLILVSLLVLFVAVMWTFVTGSAVNFCKGFWKSSST